MRQLNFRQVHLDFHTGPAIPEVGKDFDPDAFVKTLTAAHVNGINLFAKCHHGLLYYDTKRAERHPGLPKGLDLLGKQLEACKKAGIAAPIYLSVLNDEYAAKTYPDWVARTPDGAPIAAPWVRTPAAPFLTEWTSMDLDSPYLDYLCDQLAEVLKRYHPVDGIWFDMCWDQVSSSSWAIEAMTKKGLDPANEADRRKHAGELAEASLARMAAQVRAASPDALIYFNVRPVGNLPKEHQYMEQVEIESLPTGGWGYMHFPKVVRRVRRFGKPYLGMTARFHGSWADFGGLKPYPALEYETSLMVAHGGQCSIGDQLHPRGQLDVEAYELIGRAYARIEAREPWLTGAVPVTEVAVLEAMPDHTQRHGQGIDGAVRLLNQLRQQYDIVRKEEDLSAYKLIILPDDIVIDEKLAAILRARLKAGARILATGWSGLSEDATSVVLSELGVTAHGESPYTDTYIRALPGSGALRPESDHVVHGKGVQVKPTGSGKLVAELVEPYFQRSWRNWCSHRQTPPDKVSAYAGAVVTATTAYACWPLFDAFARHGNAPLRILVGELIDRLLPEPLLRAGGPTGMQTTLCRQGQRLIAHLLFYPAERRAHDIDLIEDILILRDVPLSVRAERAPKRVYLAPEGRDLPFQYRGGRIDLVVPEIAGHAMVVIE